MTYLKRLWIVFAGFFKVKRSPFDSVGELKPTHTLARALRQSNMYSREKVIVKERGFLPNRNAEKDRLETSVFNVEALKADQCWALIDKFIEAADGNSCLALAKISAADAVKPGLSCDGNDDPPRHVAIVGWPPEKHRQKILAMQLATYASLVVRE